MIEYDRLHRLHAGHRKRLSPGASDIIESSSVRSDGGLTTDELLRAAHDHAGHTPQPGATEREIREAAAEALSDLSVRQVYDLANRR